MKANLFKSLEKYDTYLTTASKADFIRSLTTTQLDELIGIGAELGIYYKNNHCPKCTLEFIKKLAVPYFEHKDNLSKKKTEKKITKKVIEEPVQEVDEEEPYGYREPIIIPEESEIL